MSTPGQQTFAFRRVAAEGGGALRRNLVIEAGAGTGKTTAIVAEVLKLLLGDDEIAPERMVLVTFTEKAAGKMPDAFPPRLRRIKGSPIGGRKISIRPPF